ncbi:hypothetical protein G3570_07010 [Balneolaceae bacterium YR4-1]|uniref:SPOR domain-containing protein n=1 Tax=Halalkalibaculum roseum TaxID=2709311 RepID=A0A6M1SYX2_9BACT|nr:SPOR domain-containing protein [Halalkalibaculum roseum]NGP76374.1 hypothetical protein [Halalkalibaculum roseum]
MTNKNIIIYTFSLLALLLLLPAQGVSQDKIPVREYTNPEEVVTFDRTTPFERALDIINEFSQEARGKVIIDRTGQSGSIGISVPAMHWEDALDLILRVNGLVLLEREKFFEIVQAQTAGATTQQSSGAQQGSGGDEEGPAATTRSREVRINAIFFEGNKRALQEIGVDWSTLTENVPENISQFANPQQGGASGGGGGGAGGQNEGQLPSTTFENQFVSVNSKGASSVSQNVFNSIVNFGEIGGSGIRVQALFSAFEADNLGEILASPTVKVLDGQEGRIQVGQDFSIKQRDFAGNVTDQFFSVGTILQVTPQIIEQQDTTFIHLTIEAERSSAQPDPVSTVINKQQATTQSVLMDGEATVIAGLYRTESSEVRRGIPVLKDLPPWFFGLRYLFGYNSTDYQMRELVILIQASIEPSIPERFAKTEYKDKFEILGQERERIREELRKSTMNTDKLIEREEEPAPPETMQEEEEGSGMNDTQPMMEEEPEQQEEPEAEEPEEPQETSNNQMNMNTDPEVKTEPVTLNFDLNDEEEATDQNQDQDADSEGGAAEMTSDTSGSSVSGAANSSDESTQNTTNKNQKKYTNGDTYYVIAGSFKNEQNAVDFKDRLATNNYPAVLFNKPDSDFFFVAYDRFSNLNHAKAALADIVQNENDGAWIYKMQ